MSLELYFLGTGGGRFVMITQRRRTAGVRLVSGDTHIHIDPGPGALVFSNWAGLSPQRLDALVVTHRHPDHYCDAEVFVEAMTHGTTKRRGVLAAPRSVLRGDGDSSPSVSAYHQRLVEEVKIIRPSDSFEVGDLKFSAIESRHSDPDTVGLRIKDPAHGSIGYTSDTGYFEGLGELYGGLRLLVLCTLRPRGRPLHMHLSTDEAAHIVENSKPRCVVLTHFGTMMLNAGPEAEAEHLERETGVPTVAARDGMKITLAEEIVVSGPTKKEEPRVIQA